MEAGIGIGRLIPDIAPIVDEFVGVDIEKKMLQISQKIAVDYHNVKIIKSKLEELTQRFDEQYFDYTLCLWNTLGNLDDEVVALKQMSAVTQKKIILTIFQKGTIEDKKNWYETVGVPIERIDIDAEIFYTGNGLQSRAYSLDDIQAIAQQAGLDILHQQSLNDVMWWIELIPKR